MPVYTIFFGIALMGVGIGAYAASENQPSALLIPIIFGLVALALGVGSIVKKDLRKHLMHGAAALAALGVLIPVIQLLARVMTMWTEQRDQSLTLLAVLMTVALSGGYVYVAYLSFKNARAKAKDEPPAKKKDPPARKDVTDRKDTPDRQDPTPPPATPSPATDPQTDPTDKP